MKKRNLNFLLALLAALALVFAGACSDGSDDTSGGTGGTTTDDTSGNGNTPGTTGSDGAPTDYAASYYNTTWTAEESIVRTTANGGTVNVESSDVSIEKATIAFGTSTSSATLTLVFTEEAGTVAANSYTQWTKALTISSWSADESGNVAIALPTGADDGDNVAGLNLTLSDSTLTLASVTYTAGTAAESATASYTVSLEGATSANGNTAGASGSIGTSSSLDIFSETDIDGLGVFKVESTAFTKVTD